MNPSSIIPTSLRAGASERARSRRHGLLLGGVAGLALFSGSLPLQAQMLSGSTTAKSSSGSARDILNRAHAQEVAGSVALAAVLYREALAASPRDVSVARELARFYSGQKRLEEAAAAWRNVLQLQGGDPEATGALTKLGAQLRAIPQIEKTGVGNVSPLPPVIITVPQTRALAQTRSTTSRGSASPVSTLPKAPSSTLAPSRPTVSKVPPSKNVSAIPFVFPAHRTVKVSDDRRIDAFPYVNRASKLLAQKQTERALLEYQQGEQKDPANAYATPGLGTSQIILGRFSEAANTYRDFLPIAPAEAVLTTLRGLADALTYSSNALPSSERSRRDQGYREAIGINDYILSHYSAYPIIPRPNKKRLGTAKFEKAMVKFEKDQQLAQKNARFAATYQNAQLYSYLGDYTKANSAFQNALSIDSNQADAWVTWSEILSYRQDPRVVQASNNAIALYRIKKNEAGIARANLALGNYYLYTGKFDAAIPLLQAATRRQPSNVAALVSLGDAFTYQGQPGTSLGPYSNALAQIPANFSDSNYVNATVGKGRALVYLGRYADGARLLNPVVAAGTKKVGANAYAQALEALAIARSGNKSQYAADTYKQLLALQKDDASRARVYASIGDSQLAANNTPESTKISQATQSYAQAVRLAPTNVEFNLTYAQLLYYNNQPREAIQQARKVLAFRGRENDPQANAVLMQASIQINDLDTASQIATRFQNATPGTAEASLALALALRSVGGNDADVNRLLLLAAGQQSEDKTSRRLVPLRRDTKIRIAATLRDTQNFSAANTLYQQLLNSDPNDIDARLGYVQSLFWSTAGSGQGVNDPNLSLAQTQVQSLLSLTPKEKEQGRYEQAQILAAQIGLKLGTTEGRDNAVRYANAVLVRDPSNPDARAVLGEVLLSLGRYSEAAEQLRAAVTKLQAIVAQTPPGTPDNDPGRDIRSRYATVRLELARTLYYGGDLEGSITEYREINNFAPLDTTPRLELAQLLLDNGRYAEAESLYNEILKLRNTPLLSMGVRRAIAANSLTRLSPLALQGSPVFRSVALLKPRASNFRPRVASNHTASTSRKRVLLAQNPTVSGPTSPIAGDLGTGANPVPDTGAPTTGTPTTDTPTTDTPETAPPITGTPATEPPTPAPSVNDDPTVAPPTPPTQPGNINTPETGGVQQPGTPTPTPDTTTPTPGNETGSRSRSEGGLIDSPVERQGTEIDRQALRGLGQVRLRQERFEDALNYFNQALRLLDTDPDARIGVARSLRGLRQFQDALQQVQQVLGVSEQSGNVAALVLQAQLLADIGQREQAQTQLNTLIGQLSNPRPDATPESIQENYIQIILALNSVGNYPAALDLLDKAAQLPKANNDTLIRLRAETLRSSGQTEQALAVYDQLLSAKPDDVDALLGKARTYNYANRLADAEAAYQQVFAKAPTNVAAKRELAAIYARRGNFDAAIPLYNEILSTNPDDLDALLGRARAYNYSNRLTEAETDYRLFLTKATNAGAQAELADILGRLGNYTESISLFNTAIAADPTNLRALINLARVQRRAELSSDAEATLNKVLEIDPNSVDALIERGLIRGGNGSYAAGIADLTTAQSLVQSDNPTAQLAVQLGLAQLQLYSGNYIASINSYQAYLTSKPDDTRARAEFAQALSYAGRTKEALAQVDQVLSTQPDDVRAKLVRADIYARTGRAPEAVNIYNEVLAQNKSEDGSTLNLQARIGLGDALLYSRRYTDAINNYDEILKADPKNVSVQISRARSLSYAGNLKEATSILQAIIAADSKNVPARLALAEVGANSGKAVLQRDAIGEYRSILRDYPDNLTAQLGLARVLSYRGEYTEASTIANKILAANPSDNDARLVLADSQQYSGRPFEAKKNYDIIARSEGASAAVLASAKEGRSDVSRATSSLIGPSANYYADTNGVRLRSAAASATLRGRKFSFGVLAEKGKFQQNNLAERDRRNIGVFVARNFGPFAAQLIVSRLKYSGVGEKTLFNASIGRYFTPRKRVSLTVARRDVFESDLAVSRGITTTSVNLTSSIPLGKLIDLDTTATYYDYSDSNNRITLSPALMFRFRPTNPTVRIGLGYTYDDTDQARNEPFVYYTPQNFNSVSILADYIVTKGDTRYGLSGALPITGSTGQDGINRPARALFAYLERNFGDRLEFYVRGGIIRVRDNEFRSNQVSGGLNFYF